MNGLGWDTFEVSEFFLHDSAPFQWAGDDLGGEGYLYRASDEHMAAEVIILPVYSLQGFTIRDASLESIVLDLSIHARTGLSVSRAHSLEYLYCHEAIVLPGLHSYRELRWYATFYDYLYSHHEGPHLSVRFQHTPHISLRFFDLNPENRAG